MSWSQSVTQSTTACLDYPQWVEDFLCQSLVKKALLETSPQAYLILWLTFPLPRWLQPVTSYGAESTKVVALLRWGPQWSTQFTRTQPAWKRIRREPSGRSKSDVPKNGNNRSCMYSRKQAMLFSNRLVGGKSLGPRWAWSHKTSRAEVIGFHFCSPNGSLGLCSSQFCRGQEPRGCLLNKHGQTNGSAENEFGIQPLKQALKKCVAKNSIFLVRARIWLN